MVGFHFFAYEKRGKTMQCNQTLYFELQKYERQSLPRPRTWPLVKLRGIM